MQEHIKSNLNIKWDFPDTTGKGGTTTKGNPARTLIFNKVNRDSIVNQVDLDFIPLLNHFGEYLSRLLELFLPRNVLKS